MTQNRRLQPASRAPGVSGDGRALLLLVVLALPQSAVACTTPSTVHGFATDLDGATDVPTDAELWIRTRQPDDPYLVLAPVGGGPEVSGFFVELPETFENCCWVGFVPDAPLDPNTEYEALVATDPGWAPEDAARFTTGSGPSAPPLVPGVLSGSSTDWRDADGLYGCYWVDPKLREVTLDLSGVDPGPGGRLVVRAAPGEPDQDEVVHLEVEPVFGQETVSFPLVRSSKRGRTPECYVVSVRNAAGVEADSVPFCVDAPREPVEDGECGCAQDGGRPSGWLALLALGWVRPRRPTER